MALSDPRLLRRRADPALGAGFRRRRIHQQRRVPRVLMMAAKAAARRAAQARRRRCCKPVVREILEISRFNLILDRVLRTVRDALGNLVARTLASLRCRRAGRGAA